MKYKFNKKKAVSALENLSLRANASVFRDDDVFEIIQLINYCEDLESELKEQSKIIDTLINDREKYFEALNKACGFIAATSKPRKTTSKEWRDYFLNGN